MATPTVDKIRHLKGVGVFSDIGIGQFPHNFRQYNLVYGFNGCGKTTLSRLLDALGAGGPSANLAEGAEFSFTLSDGTTPSSGALASAVSRYIAVFNEDYVERTLTWKEGAAKPIIYLGKEQAELAKRLAELEREEGPAIQDEVLRSSEWSSAQRALEVHSRNSARLIAEELNLGRRYNAGNLRTDYEGASFTPDDKVTDAERTRLKEVINRSELPPKAATVSVSSDGDALRDVVVAALAARVSEISIASLQRRKDALGWIEEGLHIHKTEQECLFCGNTLMGQRVADLQVALEAGFEKFSTQLDQATSLAANFVERCREQRLKLGEPIGVLATHREAVESRRKGLLTALSERERIAAEWSIQLAKKRGVPDAHISPADAPELWDQNLQTHVNELNAQIELNNEAINNFASEQSSAREKLRRHYLSDQHSNYLSALSLESANKISMNSSQNELARIRSQIATIRAQLRTHGPAATELNRHLKSYLGHSHISLEAVEDGYRICRDKKESIKPLSEGEKTAVAFCYFLTSLIAEGRKIEETIVVLDDPISSLDARAMTHVVSTIRRLFKNTVQIFILTHNLDFMREIKKWLGKKYDAGTAEFLFIETSISSTGERSSSIEKMPKLIREYESEYHYLYSLVKSLSDNPNGFEKFAYLMPNAIRKVLDIFLAFKDPGASGLEPKVDKLINDYPDLDGMRVKAMERLAHLESHSESIGDVTTFSAYTLAQVSDAANCLLELIETVDPKHKRAMDRLCKP